MDFERQDEVTSAWRAEHVGLLRSGSGNAAPLIRAGDVERIQENCYLWDFWPVCEPDGRVAQFNGKELWMALSAPAVGLPHERHNRARLRLLTHSAEGWFDHGPALPDELSHGSREWSGSALRNPGDDTITLFYTATGRRGEPEPTYAQRIMQITGRLSSIRAPALDGWRNHKESVVADTVHYSTADDVKGRPGFINAFRDPAHFRDPATGKNHLLFSGSLAAATTPFNGTIGLAESKNETLDEWHVCPPLIHADGVNNELERPHALVDNGFYYVFWSTQYKTFDPANTGPTGLYGMVAESLLGPYRPLNGSGLVIANPHEAPDQAYSWLVLNDMRVVSFVDALGGQSGSAISHHAGADVEDYPFVGAMAPVLHLRLDGDRAELA